jgi:hypothetical protein
MSSTKASSSKVKANPSVLPSVVVNSTAPQKTPIAAGPANKGSGGATTVSKTAPAKLPVIKKAIGSAVKPVSSSGTDSASTTVNVKKAVSKAIDNIAVAAVTTITVEPVNTEVNVPATSPADGQPPTIVAVEQPVTASAIQEPLRVVKNNGKVVLNYVMYNEEFAIVDGTLTQAAIDDLYCLSDAMPGCCVHLSRHQPSVGRQMEADGAPFEDIFLREDPRGTYHGLEDDQVLYVYVEEEAAQRARDQARMRAVAQAMDGAPVRDSKGNIVRDDGRSMESCSCIYGNPCVDEYGCKDWDNRYAVAKKNGWKGF